MRNLLGRLLDRSPESLAGIARFWEIEPRGSDLHHDVSLLYRTLTDPWNFALAWEGLSPIEREILLTFADGVARDSETPIPEFNRDRDELLPAIRKLYRAGYLYHNASPDDESKEPVELFMPPELASVIASLLREQEAGDPSNHPISDLLARLDEPRLIELARDLGYIVIPSVSQRPELIGYIQIRLTDPDHIDASVKSLDPQTARLWHWLLQHPLPVRPDEAQSALGLSAVDLRTSIQALARRGLIWRGYGRIDGGRCLRLVIPEAIRRPRHPEPVPPPDLIPIDASRVDASDWIHPDAVAWDLLTLLRDRVNRNSTQLAGNAGWGAQLSRRGDVRFWRGVDEALPTGYLAFIGYIAVGLGLVADGNSLIPVAERVKSWTRLSFEEQFRQMVDLWRNAAEWFEGVSRESLHAWGADWPGMRRNLLSALSELEDGCWYTVESFVRRFAASYPSALGTHVTVAGTNEQSSEPVRSRQEAGVRQAAEITLTTACAWLGLVELAGIPKGPGVIRLTPLGASIVTGSQPQVEAVRESPPLVVQPNFEILLLTPTPRRVWALSAFADPVHLDRVSIYRLSEQSVHRALAGGANVRNVTRFLEHQSGEPLPQNVAYALHEWADRHRIIGLRQSVMLTLEGDPNPGDVEKLLRDRGIALERLPGERLLLTVSQGDNAADFTERIERILREAGHIPRRPGDE